MSELPVTFPCGHITLEGVWHLAESKSPGPVVIVCHPHPHYGGNMSNSVVLAICRALSQRGIPALRFNFRGVGRSEGNFGGGIGEQEDARAALDFVSNSMNADFDKVGLTGYSFGAGVALAVAVKDQRARCLVLVSPSLPEAGWKSLGEYRRPKLVVVGDRDSFIGTEKVEQIIKDTLKSDQYEIITGADHFWLVKREVLAEKVTAFFSRSFQP